MIETGYQIVNEAIKNFSVFTLIYRDEIGTYSMKKQRTNILSLINNQLFIKADTCTITLVIPTTDKALIIARLSMLFAFLRVST